MDIDEGLNQEIVYSISGDKEDLGFFDIDPVTGVIKLKKEINVSLVYFLFILWIEPEWHLQTSENYSIG